MYFYVFNFMQKFRFQYQFEGNGLENNFGPSVKLSDKKKQNGRQNPRWLPISSFLSHYPSTFVLLNTSRFWCLHISLHV